MILRIYTHLTNYNNNILLMTCFKYVDAHIKECDSRIKFNLKDLYGLNDGALNWNDITHDINVSTLVFNCFIGQQVNLDNIAMFMEFKNTNIVHKNYSAYRPHCVTVDGVTNEYILSIDPAKNKAIDKRKKRSDFDNQITILTISQKKLDVTGKSGDINVKVFKNGTLHLTGCRDISNFIEVVNEIGVCLLQTHSFIYNGMLKTFRFIDKDYINVEDIRVVMINSNFNLNHKIDRNALLAKLKESGAKCAYNGCDHHGVKLEYTKTINVNKKVADSMMKEYNTRAHKNYSMGLIMKKINDDEYEMTRKLTTVNIFQSGKCIAIGAKYLSDINDVYDYLMSYLHGDVVLYKESDTSICKFTWINELINKRLSNLSKVGRDVVNFNTNDVVKIYETYKLLNGSK